MIYSRSAALLLVSYLVSSTFGLPVLKREVPQEHSHEKYLTSVRKLLALNNPDGIVDPVFGLLGNAAATNGLGKISVSLLSFVSLISYIFTCCFRTLTVSTKPPQIRRSQMLRLPVMFKE